MATWAVVRDGKVTEVIASPERHDDGWLDATDANPPPVVGGTYNGVTFGPAPKPSTIPALDYLMRFSEVEMKSILSAAVVTASQGDASLLTFITKLNTSATINLADPMVIGGINALVTAGLLAAERGQQILTP
jgi:hypothetical protein